MQTRRALLSGGFTIVELAVVIFIISLVLLASFVGYGNLQQQARDRSVESDALSVEALVARYGVNNDGTYGAGAEWYSGAGPSGTYDFTPSEGSRVDIVANTDEYCIRVYNPDAATHNTLAAAFTKGALDSSCASLSASAAAVADS